MTFRQAEKARTNARKHGWLDVRIGTRSTSDFLNRTGNTWYVKAKTTTGQWIRAYDENLTTVIAED
jgi:hypothetical protein